MKRLTQILLLLLCLILTVSTTAAYSCAFAAEADQSPPVSEGDDNDEAPVSIGMQESTASIGKALIDGIWSLFGISVPGFDFTFGQMWLGVLLASVSILVVRMIFGFGGAGLSSISPRTGSTNRPRISKERRRDEF